MIRFFYRTMVAALVVALLLAYHPWGFCSDAIPDATINKTLTPSQKNGASTESDDEPRPSLSGQIKDIAVELLDKMGMDYEFAKLYATWIVGAPTFVLIILIFMLLRPRREKTGSADLQRHIQGSVQKDNRSTAAGNKKPSATNDKDQVLAFFFRLFKQQVGALPDAATSLRLIESRPTCPNDTYEMKVKVGSDWASRRMSIGLLGQGGGSRSKCYYVIYDSHMVLKVPSVPIPSFSVYRKQIKTEAGIVEKLYPRECIVPRTAVILKAVHTLEGGDGLSEDAQEEKYVHLLEVHPEYRGYLKIGSTFVFFMDLARHFFLSTTLDEIHRSDRRIVNEVLKQQELLWDQRSFVCRYGEDASGVCHELQDAYYRSETNLRLIVEDAGKSEDIPVFQLKQWYLKHLAGEKVDAATEDLPENLVERVNQLLEKVMGENYQQVQQYRQSVNNYIKEMHFSQHRTQLENLASNTLDLLAWIDLKDITMRDLKPENLFVAGDPNAYPIFLKDTKKFTIGLIDVETSVIMGSEDSDEIPQPQLAGTPLFATPAHLMSNVLLAHVYQDVRTILHMQDWYATIAIIYKIITGKNMFSSTALVFPELVKHIKLINPAGPDVDKDMARINRMFWTSAVAEFKSAIAMDLDIFKHIEVAVPKSMISDMIRYLDDGCDQISSLLAKTVSQQSVFTGRDKCQYLLDVPVEKVRAMRQKLLKEKPSEGQLQDQHDKAIVILDRIEEQKWRLQRKSQAAASLKSRGNTSVIAADQLLEAMFERVFSTFYLSHWPVVEPSRWQGGTDRQLDMSTFQVTM